MRVWTATFDDGAWYYQSDSEGLFKTKQELLDDLKDIGQFEQVHTVHIGTLEVNPDGSYLWSSWEYHGTVEVGFYRKSE